MRKFLCLLLVGLLCAGALAGCAAKEDTIEAYDNFPNSNDISVIVKFGEQYEVNRNKDNIETDVEIIMNDGYVFPCSPQLGGGSYSSDIICIFLENNNILLMGLTFEIPRSPEDWLPDKKWEDVSDYKITIRVPNALRTITIHRNEQNNLSVVSNQKTAL